MKTFYDFLSEGCAKYPLRTIIDNLDDESILEAINSYAKQFIVSDKWYQLSKRELALLCRNDVSVQKLPNVLIKRLIHLGAINKAEDLNLITKDELLIKYKEARRNNIDFKINNLDKPKAY